MRPCLAPCLLLLPALAAALFAQGYRPDVAAAKMTPAGGFTDNAGLPGRVCSHGAISPPWTLPALPQLPSMGSQTTAPALFTGFCP
jgi:hypothetical protein